MESLDDATIRRKVGLEDSVGRVEVLLKGESEELERLVKRIGGGGDGAIREGRKREQGG